MHNSATTEQLRRQQRDSLKERRQRPRRPKKFLADEIEHSSEKCERMRRGVKLMPHVMDEMRGDIRAELGRKLK